MKEKDSSANKGYAFVTFRTRDMASDAIKDLNNCELKVIVVPNWYLFLFKILCHFSLFF